MSKKILVAILGATGSVGQRFIKLLHNHPWFQVVAVAASERSVGKKYSEAVNWLMSTPIPSDVANLIVQPCKPNLDHPCTIAFSGLDSEVAGDIETAFAEAGYIVHSNARNHRMNSNVPLLVPEVNPDHLALAHTQPHKGRIVTNPNCSTIGLVMALKPLQQFGIEAVSVVTLQAVSGAGYPGIASLDIMDNVIPLIKGEEHKMETETLKILGKFQNDRIEHTTFKISAQCNRVAVNDGHTECVSIKFKNKPTKEQMIDAWERFASEPQRLNLPTAPLKPIYYFHQENFPQPKLHRCLDKGMALSIGRLRECPIFDYKFTILSHNTIRGAAGGAILNAELMWKQEQL